MKDERVFSILLVIAASLILVFNIIFTIVGIKGVKSVGEAYGQSAYLSVDSLAGAAELSKAFGELEANLYKLALSAEDPVKSEQAAQSLAECNKSLVKQFDDYAMNIVQMNQMQYFDEAKQLYLSTVQPTLLLMQSMTGSSQEELLSLINAIEPDMTTIKDNLSCCLTISKMLARFDGEEGYSASMSTIMVMIAVAVLSIGWPIALLIGAIIHYFTVKARLKAGERAV